MPNHDQTRHDFYVTDAGQVLRNLHDPSACAGRPCVIHHPSDHPMRDLPTFWREDRGFMERTCSHGVGHPDPDDYFADRWHGCDGCCAGAYNPSN